MTTQHIKEQIVNARLSMSLLLLNEPTEQQKQDLKNKIKDLEQQLDSNGKDN